MITSIILPRICCILFLSVFIISCDTKDEILLSPTGESITGVWIYEAYNNGISEYSRANQLADDKPGWIFHSNGNLTDRQNSGFCGTPPISYANFNGSWQTSNDLMVQMNSKFWGGDMNYKLEIVSVSSDRLMVRVTY